MADVSFTGRGFLRSKRGRLTYEHYHRYAACREPGKDRVLSDIASLGGCRSDRLASSAKEVLGIDVGPVSVPHAKKLAGNLPNLPLVVGDCRSIPVQSGSIELIVSLETIEHAERQEETIQEFRRVSRPRGIVIVSSPDREEHRKKTGQDNLFHVACTTNTR